MAWVHQVLCGFKSCLYLFAWRRGHQKRGATHGSCAGAAVLIFDAARVPDSVHQEAMWPNCGAGPRGSMHVLEAARERVAGPAGPTRVPRGFLADPSRIHFTLRGSHTPFGF